MCAGGGELPRLPSGAGWTANIQTCFSGGEGGLLWCRRLRGGAGWGRRLACTDVSVGVAGAGRKTMTNPGCGDKRGWVTVQRHNIFYY